MRQGLGIQSSLQGIGSGDMQSKTAGEHPNLRIETDHFPPDFLEELLGGQNLALLAVRIIVLRSLNASAA